MASALNTLRALARDETLNEAFTVDVSALPDVNARPAPIEPVQAGSGGGGGAGAGGGGCAAAIAGSRATASATAERRTRRTRARDIGLVILPTQHERCHAGASRHDQL